MREVYLYHIESIGVIYCTITCLSYYNMLDAWDLRKNTLRVLLLVTTMLDCIVINNT